MDALVMKSLSGEDNMHCFPNSNHYTCLSASLFKQHLVRSTTLPNNTS